MGWSLFEGEQQTTRKGLLPVNEFFARTSGRGLEAAGGYRLLLFQEYFEADHVTACECVEHGNNGLEVVHEYGNRSVGRKISTCG